MKRFFLTLFFLLFFIYFSGKNKLYSSYIEVDLNQRNITIIDLKLNGYQIAGNFDYRISKKRNGLIYFIQGKDLRLGNQKVKEVQAKVNKKGDILFIEEFKSPNCLGTGNIDLENKKFILNFQRNWQENTEHLTGKVSLKAKVWGDFNSFLVSGNFIVSDGLYEGLPFRSLRCSFLGVPPVFNVTDAEVLFEEGSVFELKGDLDIRGGENFFPDVEFVSQKLFIDGWQIFGAEEEVGLRKQIDSKFEIEIDSEAQKEAGTELRYSLENDNFLKLRMQDEETILGFERKKEF